MFAETGVGRALPKSPGFREVGIYHRHGKLDGARRDVVSVELLLDIAGDD
ncbi:MAG: hypothetical protein KGJ62_03965 [Armatimonadetes bacterium]|nr:hypothetical protein [Armatimonadota bacterium]MDE2207826.1 hypothetical protein [Armatimonadota bacterium]